MKFSFYWIVKEFDSEADWVEDKCGKRKYRINIYENVIPPSTFHLP